MTPQFETVAIEVSTVQGQELVHGNCLGPNICYQQIGPTVTHDFTVRGEGGTAKLWNLQIGNDHMWLAFITAGICIAHVRKSRTIKMAFCMRETKPGLWY